MSDILTVVTATMINSDGETEAFSESTESHGTLDEAIEAARDGVIERFADEQEYSTLESRIIISVIHLPKPKTPTIRVESTLPAEGEGDTVTTTIS